MSFLAAIFKKCPSYQRKTTCHPKKVRDFSTYQPTTKRKSRRGPAFFPFFLFFLAFFTRRTSIWPPLSAFSSKKFAFFEALRAWGAFVAGFGVFFVSFLFDFLAFLGFSRVSRFLSFFYARFRVFYACFCLLLMPLGGSDPPFGPYTLKKRRVFNAFFITFLFFSCFFAVFRCPSFFYMLVF